MVNITGSELAAANPNRVPDERALASGGGQGGGRVALIVEGEAPIGAALADPLAAIGWQALVARGPEDAVVIARDHAVDLLVADFHLGTTTGESLAASLTRRQETLPVVLISGVQDAARVEVWLPTAFAPTVLGVDALISAIAALFDAPHGSPTFVPQQVSLGDAYESTIASFQRLEGPVAQA
jgi:CheY-like chemotaxis protein